MKKILCSILLASTTILAIAQLNMTLTDQINYPQGTSSLWGYIDPEDGTEYAAVGTRTGVSIVDISDPNNVVEIAFKPDQINSNSTWREVKSYGHYVYSVTEAGGGLQVINMTNPNNVTSTNWAPNIPGVGTLNRVHSITVDEFGFLYLNGCTGLNAGGPIIVDVSADNGNPVYAGKLPAIYCHDSYVRNNIAYTSDIYDGKFRVYDVTNKQNPVLLAEQQTPYSFTHNTWLNDAGDVIFTTDEKQFAPVTAYDISDLDNIVELDRFRPIATSPNGNIPHNVHVWDDWVVTAYYTEGTLIIDGSRPENMIEVGYFDSFVSQTAGFFGVWGVYPYFPSGLVIASDMTNGLLVYDVNYVRACWLEGKVTNAITGANVSGASVSIASPQANAGTTDLQGNYKTGQAIPGVFNVTFTATGYFPKTVPATLENGVLTILDVALEPLVINPFPAFAYSTPTAGCEPLTVNFSENTGIVASWSWTFGGGTPATSTEQSPTVQFGPGTHSVSLQVVTQGGNTYNLANSNFISVAPAPAAAFSSSVDSLTVSFANASTNFNALVWSFGDGDASTDANPQHSYPQAGSYTATLTVTGDCSTDVFTEEITIGPFTPVAGFGANGAAGCGPLTVSFTDQSSHAPTSWEWSFPGGDPATSTEQNPTVTYAQAGSFDVALMASNTAGSSQSFQASLISVETSPNANFSAAVNGPEAQFSNASVGSIGTYSWDFGDGQMSSEENPLHVYAAAGPYNVYLTVNNACGTSTFLQNIAISQFLPTAGFNADITAGCAPLTVAYSDMSSGSVNNWSWTFPGGSPATSDLQNPVVTYSNSGTFSASLLVENDWGTASANLPDLIVVNNIPTVDFDFTINGNEVSFLNYSNYSLTYEWAFNDGSGDISTELNPVHDFPGPGTYEVQLIATNNCGAATYSASVTIAAIAPTAVFVFSNAGGCAPVEVQFADQSEGNPTAWAWSFPGGIPATSTEQNPTVSYAAAGVYSATLAVTNSVGTNVHGLVDIITVNAASQANFTTAISDLAASFANASTGTGPLSYVWDFGDGNTSTDENPAHIYATNGIYEVILTATNGCGTSTHSAIVTITATAPTAAFTLTSPQGCAPMQVQFADQSAGEPTAWAWSFPGGSPATSIEQNPVVTYAAVGVYDATLTVTNSLGTNEATQAGIVTVTTAPQADFTAAVTDLTAVFTNASTGTGSLSYAWDFGDSGTSSEENPAHDYALNGVYTATLTVTNNCGSTTYEQDIIIEVSPPSIDFGATILSFCAPAILEFVDLSSGFIIGYEWSFPGGNPASSTEQNPTVTYASPGDYSLELAVTGPGGTSIVTAPNFLAVVDVPQVGFDFTVDEMQASFTNTSQNAATSVWDFGDGTGTSTEPNPEHEYAEPGSYEVTLTVSNECGSVALTQTVTILPSGTGEAGDLLQMFSASPNPFSGQVWVSYELKSVFAKASIIASNALGEVVAELPIQTVSGTVELREGFPASGVYFLRLVVDGQVAGVVRVVKI